MTFLELIVLGLALFIILPKQLELWRLDYLLPPIYIIAGIIISSLLDHEVRGILKGVAQGGFILLLFSVGLEIKLPGNREWWPAVGKAILIYLLTFLLAFGVAQLGGLPTIESLIGAAALSGVSVSLVFSFLNEEVTDRWGTKFLHIFVALELITIAVFSLAGPLLKHGVGPFIFLKVFGIIFIIFILSRLARKLGHMLARALEATTHYRTHVLLLTIFAVSALGERLGLSAPKTAFFLGLFMSYTKPFGRLTHTALSPIGERFLIPVFLISLGAQFQWNAFDWSILLPAVLTAFILWSVRYWVFHRVLGGTHMVATLSSINLTLVAIALEILNGFSANSPAALWVFIAGTLASLTGFASAGRQPSSATITAPKSPDTA